MRLVITKEMVTGLRDAAAAGDMEAARELGRLMCLVPVDPEDPAAGTEDWDVESMWPAEPWLRIAVSARPEDALAKKLLAGVLLCQIDSWQNACEVSPDVDEAEVEAANERRRAEAERLYTEVLRVDPGDLTARAGLRALVELVGEGDRPQDGQDGLGFAYYCVELYGGTGSAVHQERLVVADSDELQWACDVWLGTFYSDCSIGSDELTITVYSPDREAVSIPLGAYFDGTIDWSSVTIPQLTGARLPVGHPAPQRHAYYGYNSRVD